MPLRGLLTQQGVTVDVYAGSGLSAPEVWTSYSSVGGMCSMTEAVAYLHGLAGLPELQRDLVSHAINELLAAASFGRRAPYSSGAIAIAAGYSEMPFEGSGPVAVGGVTGSGSLPSSEEAEARRVEALQGTGVLDIPSEERFDRITRQAQQCFGVSSSSIAFISRDRQIIKSVTGPIGQDMPRELSFCHEAIRFDRILVINDASRDYRFEFNPLVQGEPHIRFYAGHPLIGADNWRIGTFCIIHDEPRTFTRQDEHRLRTFAALAQLEIAAEVRQRGP